MKHNFLFAVIRQIPYRISIVLVLAGVVLGSGCRQSGSGSQFGQTGPFGTGNSTQQQSSFVGNQPVNNSRASAEYAALAGEMQKLNQRLGSFDSDNQSLNTEVASLQQKLQLANQYNQTLKQQLADTSNRVRQSDVARQAALQRLAETEARMKDVSRGGSSNSSGQLIGFGGNDVPSGFSGGATIRANNSLRQKLNSIQIAGSQARMDGDVIRVEIPTDRLFVPGTYQVQPAQLPLLQNLSAAIRREFPKQMIGVEAHWDNTALNPPTTTHHQLTATQALAVFDNLVRLGVPKDQMFTMGMASNRPRYPQGVANGISANRRVEIVIYPETTGKQ